jgi:hypothetical protein
MEVALAKEDGEMNQHTIAPLTPEQLGLHAAPHLRSLGELSFVLGMHGLTAIPI